MSTLRFILLLPLAVWTLAGSAQTEPVAKGVKASLSGIKTSVAPMLKTVWGQNSPFNSLCPDAPGTTGRKCKTGCVATAMAQVMNYWQWPESGTGQSEYTYRSEDNGQDNTLSTDYTASHYQWNLMRTTYPQDASPAEDSAVAMLMSDCGRAVQMTYGRHSSGAFDMDVAGALSSHFGYSSDATWMFREDINDTVWYSALYRELSDGRPVIYGGSSLYMQHCFVIDGYDDNGRFHVNWGMEGGTDGWFNLDSIAYKYGQSMTVGIRPVKATAIRDIARKPLGATGLWLADGTKVNTALGGLLIVRTDDGKVRKVLTR